MKTEKKQVHFLSDVFAAVVSSDLKFPIFCAQKQTGWGQGVLDKFRKKKWQFLKDKRPEVWAFTGVHRADPQNFLKF